MTPTEILKKYWGYSAFRPGQAEIVEAVLAGRDTLALLPTGGGKSICFQVPALALEGVTLVVSPLIALMKDQVRQLRERGIIADAIYSGMRKDDIDRILDNAVYGNTKLLYLSPERLLTELARVRIEKMNVALIAVDEAHCISQWGYDFRPPYLRIAEIRALQPEAPVIAVTATATPEVVQDIQDHLQFGKDRFVYQQSFGRSNLAYVVRRPESKEKQLLQVLEGVPGTSIVYVRSRGLTKEIALSLQRRGISAASYHAGLEPEEKDRRQEAWIKGQLRVIVATNAFGMGIDKPDVRSVIHYGPPDSPEAYFQEAGRGGRDGQLAYAIMLYHPHDGERLRQQFLQSFPEIAEIRRTYRALGSYLQLAVGGGKDVAYDFDITAFVQRFGFEVRTALASLKALERAGHLLLTDAIYQPARLQFIATKEQLYDYQLKNRGLDKLIKSILRTSQGAFLQPVDLQEGALANFLNLPLEDLQRNFRKMASEGIIGYYPTKEAPQLVFLEDRVDPDRLYLDVKQYHFLRDRAQHRIETMIAYVENGAGCRSLNLLRYFGEDPTLDCGICDVCRAKLAAGEEVLTPKKVYADLRARLEQEGDMLLEDLCKNYGAVRAQATKTIVQHLINEGLFILDGRYVRQP
ncbi:ATP-dependent DNA helicase RecQ [Neolewinella lacunae]|uniref:ATP-dependent DNA helicase RecQ n=1 Tax=Neolewinella lacunae TaxID=1517758 RepID=A0A923PQ46_9BACT|nr:ATP-dependent DNA helicase RecQ [Neolewinella lacunae]MBC6995358.1 RecQ family ATP-dependent DNA helicase [Neolewinella lacunae]MDN3633070.1 ATP-dependent DNA helicase RecQ [Neolewinella lacunae]